MCPLCDKLILRAENAASGKRVQFEPPHSSRAPLSETIPDSARRDYTEAAAILKLSPRASAALSRRCLEYVLQERGYKAGNLEAKVAAFLASEVGLPEDLRLLIDTVRIHGNFGLHIKKDAETLEILDVAEHEAEASLDVLDSLFDHAYVGPARAKARLAEAQAKVARTKKGGG